jgi:RNA polymerase sigma-70 factor, ECF subfamily
MNSPQNSKKRDPQEIPQPTTGHSIVALFSRAYPRLTTIAASILGRQEGADDIVQQAARVVLEKPRSFPTDEDLLAWTAGVVRKCALNERRKQQRRRTFATDPGDMAQVIASGSAAEPAGVDPQTGRLSKYQTCFDDRLLTALCELSDDARCCLLLRTIHDLSYDEIARLLNIPPGTAMSHVHRSRKTLRQRLAPTPTST